MSTRIAKEDMVRMMPNSVSHYFRDDAVAAPAPAPVHKGLFARLAGVVRAALEYPHRRRVINELYGLSPRELADIGLTRAEVPLVFDIDFATSRLGGNFSNPQVRDAERRIHVV